MKRTKLKKIVPFIKTMSKLRKNDLTNVLSHLDDDGVNMLCECIYNCISGNKLSTQKQKKLKRALRGKKHLYRYLSKKGNSLRVKRKLLPQIGGALPLILTTVLPVVVDLISSLFKK